MSKAASKAGKGKTMPAINSDTRGAWQDLANQTATNRPSKGKQVRVTEGRHAGKIGIVTWHGASRYRETRYCSDAQLHLRDMVGREGFRCGVRTDSGETFFVDADKVDVIQPGETPEEE